MAKDRIRSYVTAGFLVALLVGFVITLAAQNGGQEVPAKGQLSSAQPITINDLFAEIGRRVPEFGGMFVDAETDTLYVYMVPGGTSGVPELNQAITQVLGPDRPRESRTEVLQGQYSFVQLKEWHDRMSMRVLAIPGTVLTEIDHATNRLKVGVEALPLEPEVSAKLAELGVPREAVNIEETLPAKKEILLHPIGSSVAAFQDVSELPADTCLPAPCTLRKKIRRLVGGIQIQENGINQGTGGDTCTLGVIADLGFFSAKGIVTASHCTNRQGGIMNPAPAPVPEREPTIFFQPIKTVGTSQIGVEMIDPCYWHPTMVFPPSYPEMNVPSAGDAPCMSPPNNPPLPLWCPPGSPCRLTDSAFAMFKTVTGGDVTFRLGFIARPAVVNASNPPASRCTDATCNVNWDGVATFQIVAEGIVMVGEPISKVGRTTGRTQGIVTDVCVNANTGPEVIICFNRGDPNKTIGVNSGYWSLGGDSGSPVFECLDKRDNTKPIACNDANAKCDTTTNTCDVKIVGIHFLRGGGFSPIGNSNDPRATGVQNGAHELGPFFKCVPGKGC